MEHDFNKFPELTNGQMDLFYFQSPHRQIFEDFTAEVVKVIDGDTIRLRVKFRDFDFPLRFLGTNAKELGEGGEEAKEYLENILQGQEVYIVMDSKQRVGKWGRLLGEVIHKGIDIGDMMIQQGRSTTFENRNEGKLPDMNKELNITKWLA